MIGIKELKDGIEITETTVECPVKGCSEKVERQREVFKREERFKCPKHNIYISSTTFEYQSELDNLLWKNEADLDLFKRIKKGKRESRIARDNSEDAVTWNVFRFLERNNLLSGFLEGLHNSPVESPEIIYWSYSQSQQEVWNKLEKARKEFGESPQRSSEPDLIIKSNDALFFIGAKLTAPNKVDFNKNHTAEDKAERVKRYSKGNYFLKQPVEHIMDAGYYQLMRFWLIGAWIADNENLNFYLLNLVRKNEEKYIESKFGKYIEQNENRKYLRTTWEDIYKYISATDMLGEDKDKMLGYFRNKTIGYPRNGELQKVFLI